MLPRGRRTQVAKGAVCKTAIQRFEPARRLHSVIPGNTQHCHSRRLLSGIQKRETIKNQRMLMRGLIRVALLATGYEGTDVALDSRLLPAGMTALLATGCEGTDVAYHSPLVN